METKVDVTEGVKTKKAPIAQTSAKAQEMLNKAAAAKAKAQTTAGTTVKDSSKPKTTKEKKPSMAAKLDEILTKGGSWESLVQKANQVCAEMGCSTKHSAGSLKAHAAYRLRRDTKYLGGLIITAEGVILPKKASK